MAVISISWNLILLGAVLFVSHLTICTGALSDQDCVNHCGKECHGNAALTDGDQVLTCIQANFYCDCKEKKVNKALDEKKNGGPGDAPGFGPDSSSRSPPRNIPSIGLVLPLMLLSVVAMFLKI